MFSIDDDFPKLYHGICMVDICTSAMIQQLLNILFEIKNYFLVIWPLLYIVFVGFKNIVQMLVENGANVNAVNKNGVSVLDFASHATKGNLKITSTSLGKKYCLIKSTAIAWNIRKKLC